MMPGKLDAASTKKLFDDLAKTYSAELFALAHWAMYICGIQGTYHDKLKMTDLIDAEHDATVGEIVSNKCVHPTSDTFGKDFAKVLRSDPQNTMS